MKLSFFSRQIKCNFPINLFLTLSLTAACSSERHLTTQSEELSLLQLAQSAYEEQRYPEAQSYYQQLLQTNPTIEVYLRLAETYEAQENWENAAKVWSGMANIPTLALNEIDIYKLRSAKNYLRLNDLDSAAEQLSSLSDGSTHNPERYSINGLMAVLIANETEAVKNFKAILAIDPDDAITINNLALTYLVFDKPEISLSLLMRLPKSKSSGLNEAITLAYMEKEAKAVEKALEFQDQEAAQATYIFGQSLIDLSPKKRAQQLFGISDN